MPYSTNLPSEIAKLPHKYLVVTLDDNGDKKIHGNSKTTNWSYDAACAMLKTNRCKGGFIVRAIDLKESPYFVVDIDVENITLSECYKALDVLQETCSVKGTRKGFHFYFQNKELANLKKQTKCLKIEGDIITDMIFERDDNEFNHHVIYEIGKDDVKSMFVDNKHWNKFTKQKQNNVAASTADASGVSINHNNNALNDLLNNYFNIDANWECHKIGNQEFKIMCDNNMCLMDKKTNHSTENHSCLYVSKNGVNANCFSHGNQKHAELEQPLKELLKIEDNLFISIKDLEQGSFDVCRVIKSTIERVLKYCNDKWIVFNKHTGLWSVIKEPSFYIQEVIRKYIDSSLLFYMKKIETIEDEKEQDLLRKKVKQYTEYYNKVSKKGFVAECRDILKSTIMDNEFSNKLDSIKYKLAFKNGVLDLKTMKFRNKIEYDDYITDTLPHQYTGERQNDNEKYVLEQIKKICNYNDKHLEYYLSVLGYSLLGDAEKEKAIYYLVGQKGNNGKTLILDVLSSILPTYCYKVDSKVLEENYSKKHKLVTSFKGKRIIWCDEFDKKARVDVKMLKEIADGKTINNEVMYGTNEIININAKMFMVSNHTPTFDSDGGSNNRYRQLQFNSHFHKDYDEDNHDTLTFKIDINLADKLKNDYATDIINILIEYAHNYCQRGMVDMPDEYKVATEETLESHNKFQSWFDDNCEISSVYKTSKKELMERLPKTTLKDLKDELIRLGYKYESQKDTTINGKKHKGLWFGFRITDDSDYDEM